MLPQKLFFRIGEVAGLVGVEPHVLRYWEREFRSIRPTKSAKGQRVYSRKDVENLLRVRDLLYRDGFTIAGAKKKLQRGDDANGDAPPVSSTERTSARLAADDGVPSERAAESSASELARAVEAAPLALGGEARRPAPAPQHRQVREKLLELRAEVEAFLTELSSPQARADERP